MDTLLGCHMSHSHAHLLYHTLSLLSTLFSTVHSFFFSTVVTVHSCIRHLLKLPFPKGCAGSLPAVAGAASLDVHMLRMAFVVLAVHAVCSFTVDTDYLTGMAYGIGEGVPAILSLLKAFTAGLAFAACLLTADTDIPLATVGFLIIHTIFHYTL